MRALSRLLAVLIGLAAAAAAVVAGIETVLLVAGQPALIVPRTSWDRYLGRATWSATGIETAAAVVVGVGALLVIAQIIPRRPVRLAAGSGPRRQVWISRRGLQRRASVVAGQTTGVRQAKAAVRRARIAAKVTLPPASPPDPVQADVAARFERDLTRLGLQFRRATAVKVKVARDGQERTLR